MGYYVRRSERCKGYATEMLRQNLEKARERGIPRVMVTCTRGNLASEKVILKCGGVFEKEVPVDDHFVRRFWIELEGENHD
jgi:predicted acetyltransferase